VDNCEVGIKSIGLVYKSYWSGSR